jgi:hypothetical protein
MTLHRHGLGSLLRDGAIALPHIGYSIVEHRGVSGCTISGQVRGNAKTLEFLSRTGHELLLILENGIRLPILLTEKHRDDLTWEFESPAYLRILMR